MIAKRATLPCIRLRTFIDRWVASSIPKLQRKAKEQKNEEQQAAKTHACKPVKDTVALLLDVKLFQSCSSVTERSVKSNYKSSVVGFWLWWVYPSILRTRRAQFLQRQGMGYPIIRATTKIQKSERILSKKHPISSRIFAHMPGMCSKISYKSAVSFLENRKFSK